MPPPPFWRRLAKEERAEFDVEIRRRGYGDLAGLASWLELRGITINKSAIHPYARRLRLADESRAPVEFSRETQAAILDLAALVIQIFGAWRRVEAAIELQESRDAREPPPE